MKILLFGLPNVGKSTLFNSLSGDFQKVANYSGTTVEAHEGSYFYKNQKFELVDIPGIYDFFSNNTDLAQKVAKDYILNQNYDLIINVVDITNLDFHLGLTLDLLSLKIPTIVAVNMVDKERKHKILININKLEVLLGTKVVKISAIKNMGIDSLKNLIYDKFCATPDPKLWFNASVYKDTNALMDKKSLFDYFANLKQNDNKTFTQAKQNLITNVKKDVIFNNSDNLSLTEKVDLFLLNKFFGIPLFLLIIYLMFSFSIKMGGIFQALVDSLGSLLLIDGFNLFLQSIHIPYVLSSVLVEGLGHGLLIVVSFIPVLYFFFIAVSILEQSGYMSRVVFLTNRIMNFFGLNGKSLIPMLMGFGCTVPSVMSSRIIEDEKQRKITMLSSHFLSCGARLAVYIVFCSVFFGEYANLVIFFLYLFGFVVALFTGWIFNKIMPSKNDSYMMIDLPKYSLPTMGNTLNFANIKLFSFLKKATKFIVPLVFLLTILNNSQVSMKLYNSEKTPLEYVGRAITPILYPMGVKQENWQVSISIFSGLIAKEGAIATLASLYNLTEQEEESNVNLEYFIESIKNSLAVFINDLIYFNQIKIIDDANEEDVNMFSSIIPLFGISGALAYLIFIMMYAPCASVIGTMIKEAGAKWAWISFLWSNMLAYVTAILFYQVFNILDNPKSAILFIILAISLFYICFVYLKRALLVKNN